jgi:hypothetical protein
MRPGPLLHAAVELVPDCTTPRTPSLNYKRHFGGPPLRDVDRLRELATA